MPINSAQHYVFIEPVVRDFWGLGREQQSAESQYSKIAKVETSDEVIREYGDIGGPGRLELKLENQAPTERTIIPGPVKRVAAACHAASLKISREALMDGKVKQVKTAASAMGRAAEETPEYLFATFLDRSHNTGYPVTTYAQPLFSASHSTPYGVTFTNTLATPSALNEQAMEDIKTAFRTTIGQDGMLSPLKLKQWIVPSALAHTIEKLTTSTKTLGSANNDPNVSKGDKFVVFDYLTNATRWMAQTSYANGFYWDWREKPDYARDNAAEIMQAIFIAFFRARWGAEDPRCAYSSNAT